MTDIYSPRKRSELMSRVRATGTQPELLVRQLAHRMGYRFRLHDDRMPGRPDLVFPRHRKVILVHGCFWHSHEGLLQGDDSRNQPRVLDSKVGQE